MNRLTRVIAGVTVLGLLTVPVALGGQGEGGQQRKVAAGKPPGPAAGEGEAFRRGEQAAARLVGLALIATHETNDAELAKLVDTAIKDRKAMIASELKRCESLEALVVAVRGGDKAKIETAREDLKKASDALAASGKTVHEDVEALAAKLRELRPELEEKMKERRAEGEERMKERRPEGKRSGQGPKDVPPPLD